MTGRRVAAIIVSVIVLIPSLALLAGGGALAVFYAVGRGDDGFFDSRVDGLQTTTVAVTSEDIDLEGDPGPPGWLVDLGDVTVELRLESVRQDVPLFAGIAPADDVDNYLSGVAREEVTRLDGRRLVLRLEDGANMASPPGDEDIWEASVEGTGLQRLRWDVESGRWAVVVMNADGSAGVAADLEVAAKAGFLLPLAITMMVIGGLFTVGMIALIVRLASSRPEAQPVTPPATTEPTSPPQPVALNARLDQPLSPWRWLVKWFLAIPHFIILVFLWIAFAILTIVAGVAIVFTGRYPQGIFEFNVGVLRWSWRVAYYASIGGLGTDRYPPFSLEPDPDYPATLDIAAPGELSRGLVWV